MYRSGITILFISLFTLSGIAYSNINRSDSNEWLAPTDLNEFFTKSNAFFGKYVQNGRVDYKLMGSQKEDLSVLIRMVGQTDLSGADKNTKTAFYLNAYNLLTINAVVSNMPIKSPLDVSGFFDAKKYDVAGAKLTLNEIENTYLRPDARVHFALVCAAIGCPKLMSEAYTPEKVQSQLNNQTKKAMNDAGFIRVDENGKSVAISQIFDWYKDDFVKDAGTVMNFINKFRTSPIPSDYKVTSYTYDWNLNIK